MNEAIELIEKEDAVQASEKLYKVVEDCVKLLAKLNSLPEYKKAIKEGQWWSKLLAKAVERLRDIYGEDVLMHGKLHMSYI